MPRKKKQQKKQPDITHEWLLYQQGQSYNREISPDLYTTVDKNERFIAGDQWRGVQSNGLPTPVFNILKRIIGFFVATIMSQKISMRYSAMDTGDEPQDEDEKETTSAMEVVSGHSEILWERMKKDSMLRDLLMDGAVAGDYCLYSYWDPDKNGIGDAKGAIAEEMVDNVNVLFGNPNDNEVQTQPYILLAFRELISELRAEAKANGADDQTINMITSDYDTEEQSGDRGKVELDQSSNYYPDDSSKAMALIKLWRDEETGKISWNKVTKHSVIRDTVKTPLNLYPVSWANWEKRKNSYHGQAPATGIIPNQIFINKMFAMAMMSLMRTAFPKAMYDSTVITGWTNKIGAAIPVEGDITNKAKYLDSGNMSNQVMQVIDQTIQYTKEMLGVTDAALGNVRPENMGAIVAVQKASIIPLDNPKAGLYKFVADQGEIEFDMMSAYYGKRKVAVMELGKKKIVEFDFDTLQDKRVDVKIDVGPSTYWSEIAAAATLDNLLASERIEFRQYLQRMPEGMIPQKQELIDEIAGDDVKKQFLFELMGRFMDTLPPQEQQRIMALPAEEQEMEVLKMMMDSPQVMAEQQPQAQPPAPPTGLNEIDMTQLQSL